MSLYDERKNRILKAVRLEQTDRIPLIPFVHTFPVLRQGHTMAQALYDIDLAIEDNLKYYKDFQPDMAKSAEGFMAGEGPMLEKLGVKFLQWAGQPGTNISVNSMQQYLEKEYLEEEEYPEVISDYSLWVLNKLMPRHYSSMEAFEHFYVPGMVSGKPGIALRQFADGKIAETVNLLTEVARDYQILGKKLEEEKAHLTDEGFPPFMCGAVTTAFDSLSDYLRGTLGSMTDMILQPEMLKTAIDQFHQRNIKAVRSILSRSKEGFVFIPLHKGFDGFMSPEQYEEFYFPTLKGLVEEIVQLGGVPLVYTEGKYDARLELLTELPAGRTVIFLENADMKRAKDVLGKTHCIGSGFKSEFLKIHSPEQIKDDVKRFLDVVAPGGGYIFDVDYTLDDVSDAAVYAMFDAVKSYR